VQGTIIALFFLGATISGLELVDTEPWITDVFSGVASFGKKIAIVGTGAQGASVGSDVIRGGLDVTFIEQWAAHGEVMRRMIILFASPRSCIWSSDAPFGLIRFTLSYRDVGDLLAECGVEVSCETVRP
jgi:hypothetical protein